MRENVEALPLEFAFIPEMVAGKNIFKIPDEPTRWGFVSETFKKAIEMSGLTRFKLKLVWETAKFLMVNGLVTRLHGT